MTIAVGTALRVARINRWTTREQRDRLRGSSVVPQRAELGVGVVHVARAVEIAAVITAQVVAVGGHGAMVVAVSSQRTVGDYVVLNCDCIARVVVDPAARVCAIAAEGSTVEGERALNRIDPAAFPRNGATVPCYITAYGAAVDCQRSAVDNVTTERFTCGPSVVSADGSVVDGQRSAIGDAASAPKVASFGDIATQRALVDRQCPGVEVPPPEAIEAAARFALRVLFVMASVPVL